MAERGLHGTWNSRWTFILAATGSAVGLGNIWKFPYITGEYGGGAFVLIYLVCIALVGIPIMAAEVLLGRRGRQSPVNAMKYLTNESSLHGGWSIVGWMGVLAGLFILAFYSVVAGWILDYVFAAGKGQFSGSEAAAVGEYFGGVRSNTVAAMSWHTLFIVMTIGVVMAGVTKGLGMVARVLMPLLFVMLIILLGYGFVNGDFAQAVSFLFKPDFSKVFYASQELNAEGKWVACTAAAADCQVNFTMKPTLVALGHSFFTLSLGMGAIMAYGAYMPENAKIGPTVLAVGLLDTVVAIVAGLAIFPIVFASGIEPGSGPGLLFVSLPVAFGSMTGGVIFGTLFFVLVAIAAWSSAVSLIEPGVAWLIETKKFNRITANVLLGVVAWLGGVACIFSGEIFDFLDFLTAQIMLPLGGLLIAIFVGWLMSQKVVAEEMGGGDSPVFGVWMFVLRYVSPVLVGIIFVITLLEKFEII